MTEMMTITMLVYPREKVENMQRAFEEGILLVLNCHHCSSVSYGSIESVAVNPKAPNSAEVVITIFKDETWSNV